MDKPTPHGQIGMCIYGHQFFPGTCNGKTLCSVHEDAASALAAAKSLLAEERIHQGGRGVLKMLKSKIAVECFTWAQGKYDDALASAEQALSGQEA